VTHRQGQSVAEIAAAPSGERTLKVSATTNPKKLAGSIVLVCEGGEAPMLLPLGAACVNQAVKAIAIARRDLAEEDEPTYLSCFPDFRDDGRRTVSMQCDKEVKAPWSSSDADLTVASGTNPANAAGAIAGKVREGLKVAIRACGAEAVSNAVLAVAHARRYLKDDGVDVFFCPEFEKEATKDGQERTVVLFRVCKAAGSAPANK
jgi:stage V sporulation protein SpoVS